MSRVNQELVIWEVPVSLWGQTDWRSLSLLGTMFLASVKFLRKIRSDTDGVVRIYGKILHLVPLLVGCYLEFFLKLTLVVYKGLIVPGLGLYTENFCLVSVLCCIARLRVVCRSPLRRLTCCACPWNVSSVSFLLITQKERSSSRN